MARTFSSGPPGLLEALMWIQREAATGSLHGSDEAGAPGLAFRNGLLVGQAAAGDAPEAGPPPDIRERAWALLEDWASSGAPVTFAERGAEAAPRAAVALPNAADLILDVVRKDTDLRWVRRQMVQATGRVEAVSSPPGILPGVAMTPTEAFLLSRADGSMSLGEIVSVSPMQESEVILSLYGLLVAGLLRAEGACLPGGKVAPERQPRENAAQAAPRPQAAPPPAPETVAPPEAAVPEKQGAAASPAEAVPPRADSPAPPAAAKVDALDDFLARTAEPGPTAAASPGAPAGSDGPGEEAPPEATSTYVRSPELERLRMEVLEWIGSCAGADHYGILRVDRSAGEDQIRRAYYLLAKKFHPDKFRRAEFHELLQDVERMFAATTEAYNTLTDDRMRAEYEAEQAARSHGGRGGEADLAAQARESYLRARKHIEAEEYFDAASLLETATRLDPAKSDYWLALGSVQEKNPKWRRKAEESYKKVIEIDPTSADAYLHLARLYRAGGLSKRAAEMYKMVVQWDPQNEEALEGLSGKRESTGAGVKGRIRSIFKGSRS